MVRAPVFAPMKVSFPLSLKVTFWLLLNLLILGVAAVAFFLVGGGPGWDSLVVGPSGERINELANAITGEMAASPVERRSEIVERLSTAYHADFMLFRNRGAQLAGKVLLLPEVVRERIDEGPGAPPRAGLLGPRPGPRPGKNAPLLEDTEMDPPGARPAGRGSRAVARGRFLIHSTEPNAWWIGLRVRFPEVGERPVPATLLIRVESFWNVILLLNLESWLLVGGAVLVVSVLFWLPLVRGITRDLRALTAATQHIAEGRFDTRVATNRRDELGRLGASVNTMAERLDTLVNGQKRFLGDVAHELGSPLARLQMAVELLDRRASGELKEPLNDVREEVEQLTALVNELLAFTQAGLRPRETSRVRVDLTTLVQAVLDREDTAHRVQARPETGLTALADEPLLTRATANLVRNALRHAGETATISIVTHRAGDEAIIIIEDDGPGVPAAALARLGEPFFRPDAARTREAGGAGLGLTIVRTAMASCGGEVRFANRTPNGFRAELRLRAG